jgi:hypothetical protein
VTGHGPGWVKLFCEFYDFATKLLNFYLNLEISDSVAIEICESEIKWPSWKELGLVESRMIRRYEKEKEKEKEDQDSSKSKGTSSRGNEESAGGPRMGRS